MNTRSLGRHALKWTRAALLGIALGIALAAVGVPARAMASGAPAFVAAWGGSGSGDGRLYGPQGIAVGPDGSVYVADTGNQRIEQFSASGGFLKTWGSPGSGEFSEPWGVAVGPDGSVYVADTGNQRIEEFPASGGLPKAWGSPGSGAGQFNLPCGVAVGPDGSVYVADARNSRIEEFSASGAFLATWGSLGSGDGQFNYPSGVSVGPDGRVYVADTYNHRIEEFSASGAFLATLGSPGSGDAQFHLPYSVAVGPDGRVYVADTYNHRIEEFSASGAFLATWGSLGSGDGQFDYPYGVSVGPDGRVYVADTNNNRVEEFGYPPTTSILTVPSAPGGLAGWYTTPPTVILSPDCTATTFFSWDATSSFMPYLAPILAPSGTHALHFFSVASSGATEAVASAAFNVDADPPTTSTLSTTSVTTSTVGLSWTQATDVTSGLDHYSLYRSDGSLIATTTDTSFTVTGLSPDSDYGFYITASDVAGNESAPSNKVDVTAALDPAPFTSCAAAPTLPPKFVSSFGEPGVHDGQFQTPVFSGNSVGGGPTGIAVGPGGNVYVADDFNNRVQVFSPGGRYLATYDDLSYPNAIAVGPDGSVYVTDNVSDTDTRIVRFSPFGTSMVRSEWGHFQGNPALAIALNGNVYVTDQDVYGINPRVLEFTPNGQFVTSWGTQGSGPSQFYCPTGIAVGPDGSVYVTNEDLLNNNNNSVQRFTADGTFLAKWGVTGTRDGEFYEPTFVTVGPDGDVYVTDAEPMNRIEEFSPDGVFLRTWGGAGNGDGQFEVPAGTAFGRDGSIYVVDGYNGRVQVFAEDQTSWCTTVPGVTLESSPSATVHYSWGSASGPWSTYSSPISPDQGTHTLYYYATKPGSAREIVKSANFRIDSVAPSASTLSATSVTTSTVCLSWTAATDVTSGLDHYSVYDSDGSLIATTTDVTFSVTGLDPGTQCGFYVTASDAAGNESARSDIVNVTTLKHRSVAIGATLSTQENTDLPITLSGFDPDGGAVGYRIVSGPSHGTLPGGIDVSTLTYTPTPGYTGSDSFTFVSTYGGLESDPARIVITVEAPPPGSAIPVPTGDGVTASSDGVSVTFGSVDSAGSITVTELSPGGQETPPEAPAGFTVDGTVYDVSPDGVAWGSSGFDITLPYSPSNADPRLLHYTGGAWVDVTTSADTVHHEVTGHADSFSDFAVVKTAPPAGPLAPGFASRIAYVMPGLRTASFRGTFDHGGKATLKVSTPRGTKLLFSGTIAAGPGVQTLATWDGTVSGKQLVAGNYRWTLTVRDSSGHATAYTGTVAVCKRYYDFCGTGTGAAIHYQAALGKGTGTMKVTAVQTGTGATIGVRFSGPAKLSFGSYAIPTPPKSLARTLALSGKTAIKATGTYDVAVTAKAGVSYTVTIVQ